MEVRVVDGELTRVSPLRATSDPLFLTIVILYSAVLGLAAMVFPPLDVFFVSDALKFASAVHVITLTVTTYAHASSSPSYKVSVFLVHATCAILVAWQLRLLDLISASMRDKGILAARQLVLYYVAHLFLLVAVIALVRLTPAPGSDRFSAFRGRVRWAAAAAIGLGLLVEWCDTRFPLGPGTWMPARWAVAGTLVLLALGYIHSRPWERFLTVPIAGGLPADAGAACSTTGPRDRARETTGQTPTGAQ